MNADDMFGELLQAKAPVKAIRSETKSISQQKQDLANKQEELNKIGSNADLMARLGYLDIATDFAGVAPEIKEELKVDKGKLIKRNEEEIKIAKARRSKINGVKNYIKVHSYRNKLEIRPHDHITIIRRYALEKTDFLQEANNIPLKVLCEVIQEDFAKFKYWMFKNY